MFSLCLAKEPHIALTAMLTMKQQWADSVNEIVDIWNSISQGINCGFSHERSFNGHIQIIIIFTKYCNAYVQYD